MRMRAREFRYYQARPGNVCDGAGNFPKCHVELSSGGIQSVKEREMRRTLFVEIVRWKKSTSHVRILNEF